MKKKSSSKLKKNQLLSVSAPSIEEDKQLHALFAQGLFAETIAYAEKLAIRFPNDGFVWKAWGAALQSLGRTRESLAVNTKAVELLPNYADAHNNLGNALKIHEKLDAAEKSYRRALALKPDFANAHYNLGTLLYHQKRYAESEKSYKNALNYSPENTLMETSWFSVLRQLCDWRTFDENNAKISNYCDQLQSNGITPFSILAVPSLTPSQLRHNAQSYGAFMCKTQLAEKPYLTSIKSSHQKIRIGYLSADFCCHATVYLLAGVLENRNSEAFDVYLYSYGIEQKDAQRSRIENACEVFRNVRELSDEAIAEQILADEIDILVDLKGYTTDSRLGISALRPAPVIVSWLGFPGTLGHERLADYIIGDAIVTPLEHAENFSETLALMPYCYQPNDNRRPIGACPSREQAGLPATGFIFCTFNQTYKITPEMFAIWCRLLAAVPNSVLWILDSDVVAQENLRREMEARGVDSTRLYFAQKMEQTAHLGRLQLADLAVDTFPYTSHTTASDALWAGVPVVTKIGETFASRVAASILHTMDLSELVTTNDEDYFNVALNLAQNPEKLAAIKQKISTQKQTSPLFDTPLFAQDLERLYQAIWAQELKGERRAIVLPKENKHKEIMKNTTTTPSADEEQHLLALYGQGLFAETVTSSVALLKRFPNYGFGWKALGAALVGLGRFDEALVVNKKTIEVSPNDADAHYNLGNTLKTLRNFKDAEICYRNTLVINPNSDKAYCNLGILFKEQGRLEEAKLCYRHALEINPNFDKVYNNLGILFKELGDLKRAEISYRKAIELDPNFAEAFYNLAYTQYVQGLLRDSEQSYRDALAVRPDYVKAHHNLAQVLSSQKRYQEAEEFYANALRYSPQSQDYLVAWIFVRRYLCDWRVEDNAKLSACFKPSESGAVNSFADVVNPFTLLALENFTPQHLCDAGQLFANFSYEHQLTTVPLSTAITHKHPKLRIGYLSADFHSHATVYLMAGVLENRNTEAFEVYLYSYGDDYKDEGRSRVENACEHFHNVRNKSDTAIAQQILNDEIDILVDLKGYTSGQRLGITALRPAPVIVSWLGYPATLGHERLADYIIGDATVTPFEHASHFSESLALMPHCYQPNDNRLTIGTCPTREESGLPATGFVFCTFNQAYKVTPEMFTLWCRLLSAVPNSVLWLLEPHPAAHENLRREMQAHGVDPKRLIFAPKVEKTAHLGRLQLADLAVDTFPYTSHTTASDALWAGVPLVTKMGETFASRVAASILRTMDLAELVTTNDEDYFNVALSLAQNPEKLAAIKQKIALQKQISPLFDTQLFATDLERLYQAIWAQELKGERKAVVLESESKQAKLEFHPQFTTDENTENKFVILPFAEWEQILNALGEK